MREMKFYDIISFIISYSKKNQEYILYKTQASDNKQAVLTAETL